MSHFWALEVSEALSNLTSSSGSQFRESLAPGHKAIDLDMLAENGTHIIQEQFLTGLQF